MCASQYEECGLLAEDTLLLHRGGVWNHAYSSLPHQEAPFCSFYWEGWKQPASVVFVTFLLLVHLCLGSERRNKVNHTVDNGVQITFNYNILFMCFLPKTLKNTSLNVICIPCLKYHITQYYVFTYFHLCVLWNNPNEDSYNMQHLFFHFQPLCLASW